MVDSMDIYKSLNISIATVMENTEMLKFVPDHLKTKDKRKYAVKNYIIHEDIFLIDIRLNKCVVNLF